VSAPRSRAERDPATQVIAGTAASRPATLKLVLHELWAHHFAVLSTVDEHGRPDSAGVNYGASARGGGPVLYVMTRRHLKKARNIAHNPQVSLVVPLQRRLFRFVPPATIQLHGRAEILDWADMDGTNVFRGFWMGRQILSAYEKSRRRGETGVCFLRIALDPVIRTYGVGHSIWDLRRHMEAATGSVQLEATGGNGQEPQRQAISHETGG
jgi:general stress protein 26